MADISSKRKPLHVTVYTSSSQRACNFASLNAADHAQLTAEFAALAVVDGLHFRPIRRRTKSVQAAGSSRNASSQTLFNFPRHATTQYEARQFNPQEIEYHLSSQNFLTFFSKASLRVERVLVENDLFNPFNDHVRRLKVESSLSDLGGRASAAAASTKGQPNPRRLLHHSELCDGKFVSNLHVHPIFPGVIAAGYAAKVQLEDRQAYRDSMRYGRHFALVWKTSKLMEPLLILEAADDVLSVRFNVQHPCVIAASLLSGMIVVWDLSDHLSLLKENVKSKLFGKIKKIETTRVAPITVVPVAATLENYPFHTKRICWAPSSVEFSVKGPVGVSGNKTIHQLYTAYDGFMTVWDAKLPEETGNLSMPTRIRPLFKILPVVKDKRREVAITCFAMTDHSEKKTQTRMSDAAVYPPICIAGTDEGEVFIMDWRNYLETERGAACTASLCLAWHDGPVIDILPAPHIANAVLSIGGTVWAIWKAIDLEGPVIELPPRSNSILSAAWSPWHTSVVAIGLSNGLVEVWDILESTSRPQRQIRITRAAVTSLQFGRDQEGSPYIAIADADGTGKITLLPFQTEGYAPGLKELKKVETFIEAEIKHRLAMAQLSQPVSSQETEAQSSSLLEPIETETIPLPFADRDDYLQCFNTLEKMVLHEMAQLTQRNDEDK